MNTLNESQLKELILVLEQSVNALNGAKGWVAIEEAAAVVAVKLDADVAILKEVLASTKDK